MSIGVPPVDVYTASEFASFSMPATGAEMILLLGSSTLRIRGVGLLSEDDVKDALAGSVSVGQAANALADAYELAGWSNVLVVPIDSPTQPAVVVFETGLNRVQGYETMLPYFQAFVGEKPIRYSSIAIAAQLAEIHAARIGSSAGALYVRSREQPAEVAMNVEGERRYASVFDYQMRLSNEGNRFVGRWLGGVDATWTASSSARLGLSYDRVLPEIGDARGDPQYDGFSAFTDRVTRFGLVKLLASYATYKYRGIGADNVATGVSTADPEFRASNLGVAVQGERFVYVTPTWSWSAGMGLTYVDYDIEQIGTAASAAERYAAAHVNGGGKWFAPERAGRPQLYLDAQYRQSLTEKFEASGAEADFGVYGYGIGLSAIPFGFGRVSLSHEGQWSDDAMPQSEQWVLGGIDRLSAWLPGVAVGDRGTFTRLVYHIPLFTEERHDLRLGVSAERGTSEFVGHASDLDSELSSAGLALTYRYGVNWLLEARVGTPLEENAPASFAIEQQESDFYLRVARVFDAP